jgi:uroporphyrinogen decarboxylase
MAIPPLFLRACRGKPTERPPLWIMRQAGRYLPEYRAVRERIGFLELCKSPELACEVTLQPIRRFGFDAAILFSDILIPIEAMGAEVIFPEEGGPLLPHPVRTAGEAERLRVPDPAAAMPFVGDTLRKVRAALPEETALIGFAGAPLTLLAYLCEGGGSKNFVELKRLLYGAPATAHALLDKLARTVAAFLAFQIEAGAQAVQLFDTWGGTLAPDDYETFALPYTSRIVAALRPHGAPVIVYVGTGATLLEATAQTGCDVVGLDWRIDIAEARRRLGDRPVQGNLDPCTLFAPPETVTQKARAILARGGGRGHIFNLGHGILPGTPIASVEALCAAVRAPSDRP